jgi:hypothetical protein
MELLLKSSQNITQLIETVKLHEQNITKYYKTHDTDVIMKDKPSNDYAYVECAYGSIFNPEPMFCPLTRAMFKPEDRVILVKECKHIFSKELFLNWINFHNHCPRCKNILF